MSDSGSYPSNLGSFGDVQSTLNVDAEVAMMLPLAVAQMIDVVDIFANLKLAEGDYWENRVHEMVRADLSGWRGPHPLQAAPPA